MTVRSVAASRWRDLRDALTTLPDARTWASCGVVFAAFLLCAVPFGLVAGLLRVDTSVVNSGDAIRIAALIFIQPALFEETVFRGLLLPRDVRSMSPSRAAVVAGLALAVYVASHPLNAWMFRPQVLTLFSSQAYLVLTTLLGLTYTITYWISRSIWPSVVIHWLTVVAWIVFFGGRALLHL
jgi:predicted Abi (CAAX) family protease